MWPHLTAKQLYRAPPQKRARLHARAPLPFDPKAPTHALPHLTHRSPPTNADELLPSRAHRAE
ncbi:hypothetical protein EX30DRAFT_339697 [Ascodesmis nigricans]|uniref:Uncharacterized protein n=1 Tax=Ascodesmis nigricans TaxID=341454 RepID=A0A4S2N001_9PEZI|nr:hypothetical protein EX30DRAFT_339697 [Ascodesmis nigricans]